MTYQELVAEIKQLSAEEQLALLAEVAQSLRADVAHARTNQDAGPTTKLADEPFVGMWQDRDDFAHSTQRVREVQAQEQMNLANELFAELDINKEITIKFFIVFARFEYALKRSSFAHGSEKKVEANWDKFASTLQTVFQPSRTENLRSAVQYFCDFPPKKQIFPEHSLSLSWQDNTPDTKNLLIWLLLMVRTVRNNLFHGGKFPEGPVRELSRDTDLLTNSLTILEECLRLCEQHKREVYNHFFDRME